MSSILSGKTCFEAKNEVHMLYYSCTSYIVLYIQRYFKPLPFLLFYLDSVFNKLFVATGRSSSSGYEVDVEVIDLKSSSSTCNKPADYPIDVYGAHGNYVNGRPLICGGLDGNDE